MVWYGRAWKCIGEVGQEMSRAERAEVGKAHKNKPKGGKTDEYTLLEGVTGEEHGRRAWKVNRGMCVTPPRP